MYSFLYLYLVVVVFIVIYICLNYIAVKIFNHGKPEFQLKKATQFRLDSNYVYGKEPLSPSANGDLNCSTKEGKLIECDIDPDNELGFDSKCAQCRQIAARCVNVSQPIYSAQNPDEILIQPNSSPTKGYCLPSMTTTNTCTRRNGGKWILTTENEPVEDKHLVYTFSCFCSTPKFFQNDVDSGDCTRFVGCRHGQLADTQWTSYETMRCTCPADLFEEEIGSANQPPTCIPLNIYRRKYTDDASAPFERLAIEYIDPDYRSLISKDISLPNPCTFDVTTKTYVRGIGQVVWDRQRKVAYCKSKHTDYMPTILTDDYLYGNGGKYANAMFRYRIRNTIETNDDSDDNYNDYARGTMYEVLRKGCPVENLAGVRLPYWNFPIYLPYLEINSYNMGNAAGRHYTLYPVIPSHRRTYTMVYVFEAQRPDHTTDVVLGNGIQYIPSFMTISFESTRRVYNGAIPCVNVANISYWYNKRAFWIMYPTPPGRGFTNKLGTTGIMGQLSHVDETMDKYTAGYGFHFAFDGKVEPYTELFTGTLFTYSIDNQVYTRPVSCGDKVLTNKYRFNYDPKWINRPPEAIIGYVSSGVLQFAVTGRDGHMFTRNSFDIERHEIGVTTRAISRYELDESRGTITFKTFYP